NQQIFGNISRSWEPPRRGDLVNFFNSPQLADQSALTYEVGTRGRAGALNYDLTAYHAKVSDEILIMETPPGSRTYSMSNVPKSIHQGIEAGLETVLPLGWFNGHDEMRIRGTYTWSNFKFVSDATFGSSRLAGVPEHMGRVELQYRHPSSFSFGLNVDVASKMFADFANTQAAPGRTLLGAKVSYSPTAKLRLFLEGRNLTDERYVAFVSPQGNVAGADTRIYQPGAPRSVFAGAEFTY
ncbi:partial Fe(3+) dicitrate transport protein FecA, partial [Rhodocyclaceae bacterium]